MSKVDYAEFTDARQASLYDAFNPLGAHERFFCDAAAKLSPSLIIDLGCGTGLLSCELARDGYNVIGIGPAGAMLAIARSKPDADKVRWSEGSYETLRGLKADLILMTSHVAQFFLEDDDWQAMLEAAHDALHPGGHLIFDSVDPRTRPWEKWSREMSLRRIGKTERWYQVINIDGNRVRYEIHHLLELGEELISNNQLIYRTRKAIVQSLEHAGFAVENRGADQNEEHGAPRSSEMLFDAVAV